MSSYLTIYGIPKNEDKPIDIVSFSRSHCVYSAICDNVDVAWAGDNEVYTTLNTSDLDRVIYNLEEDIKRFIYFWIMMKLAWKMQGNCQSLLGSLI